MRYVITFLALLFCSATFANSRCLMNLYKIDSENNTIATKKHIFWNKEKKYENEKTNSHQNSAPFVVFPNGWNNQSPNVYLWKHDS